jgi:predicted SAM-dependent methyltransferase
MYLNVGSHDKTIPGFVNLDLERLGDIQGDVTDGLPIRSGSLEGVFSEHFIEHVAQPEAVAFLRECRRVVTNGGRIRVATPDLDFMVARYTDPNWRELGDMVKHGYDWVATRAEQLNIAMRAWGHQWVFDEDELTRLGRIAGLHVVGRKPMGESDIDALGGLEYREGSRLIVEFEKRRPRCATTSRWCRS